MGNWMEWYQLKYFAAAAEFQNLRKASEKLNVSIPSVSKAVSALEQELGMKLFERIGKRLELSYRGKLLQAQVGTIKHWESATITLLQGVASTATFRVAANRIAIASYGVEVSKAIHKLLPNASVEFRSIGTREAANQLKNAECDFAITTQDLRSSIASKLWRRDKFVTIASTTHTLAQKRTASIETVLKYPFVSFKGPIDSSLNPALAADGWRDDVHQRTFKYLTDDFLTIRHLVESGECLAYLPSQVVRLWKVKALTISECTFSCKLDFYLSCPGGVAQDWRRRVLSECVNNVQ